MGGKPVTMPSGESMLDPPYLVAYVDTKIKDPSPGLVRVENSRTIPGYNSTNNDPVYDSFTDALSDIEDTIRNGESGVIYIVPHDEQVVDVINVTEAIDIKGIAIVGGGEFLNETVITFREAIFTDCNFVNITVNDLSTNNDKSLIITRCVFTNVAFNISPIINKDLIVVKEKSYFNDITIKVDPIPQPTEGTKGTEGTEGTEGPEGIEGTDGFRTLIRFEGEGIFSGNLLMTNETRKDFIISMITGDGSVTINSRINDGDIENNDNININSNGQVFISQIQEPTQNGVTSAAVTKLTVRSYNINLNLPFQKNELINVIHVMSTVSSNKQSILGVVEEEPTDVLVEFNNCDITSEGNNVINLLNTSRADIYNCNLNNIFVKLVGNEAPNVSSILDDSEVSNLLSIVGYQLITEDTELIKERILPICYIDASAGDITVTLPSLSSIPDDKNYDGMYIQFKRLDNSSHRVVLKCGCVDGEPRCTIDGQSKYIMKTIKICKHTCNRCDDCHSRYLPSNPVILHFAFGNYWILSSK